MRNSLSPIHQRDYLFFIFCCKDMENSNQFQNISYK